MRQLVPCRAVLQAIQPVMVMLFASGLWTAHSQVLTSISSGSAGLGQTVSLAISTTTSGSSQPAALQWQMQYPSADISSVSITAGAVASAAGKTPSCNNTAGEVTCVIYGLNSTAITNGAVATATFQVSAAAADATIPIQLTNAVAAGPEGQGIAATTSGANITVLPTAPQVGLSCNSTTLTTPGSLTCAVSVNSAVQASGGLSLTAASSNTALIVPASINVPAASESATFSVTAGAVTSTQPAVLTIGGGSNSPSVTLSLAPPATASATLLAIDAGGSAAGKFSADKDYSGGSVYSSGATIKTAGVTNPAPQAVYQTERFGNFTYTVPRLTPGASYTVRLHFAELYWAETGRRVFNVALNGTPVLTNFDIIAAAGGKNIALVKQFTATANANGQIVVQFTTVKNNAKLSGLEVE